jgi:hypothetical protein
VQRRLDRKSRGGILVQSSPGPVRNHNGFLVDQHVAGVLDETERKAAVRMLDRSAAGRRRITVAGDKGYDTKGFVQQCRECNITPHVARNINRKGGSAIDGRTTLHEYCRVSQRIAQESRGDLLLDEDGQQVSAGALHGPRPDAMGGLARGCGVQPDKSREDRGPGGVAASEHGPNCRPRGS